MKERNFKGIDSTKREQIFLYYLRESEKAQNILKSAHSIELTSDEIYRILIDYFELDVETEVFWKELNAEQMVDILRTHKPDWLHVVGQIVVGESILPSDILGYFEKAIVKLNGEIWTIYKYDQDVFPSNPHAHNHECKLKLHLGTGELFTKDRKLVSKIPMKKLLVFREQIQKRLKDIKLPPLS